MRLSAVVVHMFRLIETSRYSPSACCDAASAVIAGITRTTSAASFLYEMAVAVPSDEEFAGSVTLGYSPSGKNASPKIKAPSYMHRGVRERHCLSEETPCELNVLIKRNRVTP